MAEDKDRIQSAADALSALGANPSSDVQPEPAPQAPPPVHEESSPGEKRPAPAPAPVRIVIKAGKEQSIPAAEPVKVEPPPPPPPLTPLGRVVLVRKIAFRRTIIPPLLVSGLAMILLGCWAVSVLALGKDPFKGDVTFQTRYLARMMLLAWPIGVILLGGAAFLMYDVYTACRQYPQEIPGTGKVDLPRSHGDTENKLPG
jgi:hypothetical protein